MLCPFSQSAEPGVCLLVNTVTFSETQGKLVLAGKVLNGAEKKFGRGKVRNAKKSPWGQGFNGPVPSGRSSSGF